MHALHMISALKTLVHELQPYASQNRYEAYDNPAMAVKVSPRLTKFLNDLDIVQVVWSLRDMFSDIFTVILLISNQIYLSLFSLI